MMAVWPVLASTLSDGWLSGRRPVRSVAGVAAHHEEVVAAVHGIDGRAGD